MSQLVVEITALAGLIGAVTTLVGAIATGVVKCCEAIKKLRSTKAPKHLVNRTRIKSGGSDSLKAETRILYRESSP